MKKNGQKKGSNKNGKLLVLLAAATVAVGGAAWLSANSGAAIGEGMTVHVLATPTCGCCKQWISYLESNGFTVEAEFVGGDAINAKRTLNNLGPSLAGCHMADIDGYLLEGHVPAEDIARIMAERPDIAGLSVPGMPEGTPGMRGTGGFRTLAFDEQGQVTTVFARH